MRVVEAMEAYLADCYGLAATTRDLYRWHLERFSRFAGDREMDDVDAGLVRCYLGQLRKEDGARYSRSFVDQVYRTLRTWFGWCVREGILERNVMERVRRPRVPKMKSPRLSRKEVRVLLRAIRDGTRQWRRNLAATLLMLDSGLRRGEVVHLDVGDVDLEAGVARVLGKDQEERYVPLGSAAVSALEEYLGERDGSGPLFRSRNGERWSGNAIGLLFWRLKEKTGISELHPHLLRHTFADEWIRNGGGLRQLQEVLGHSEVTTTAAIYVSPQLSELQKTHEAVSIGGRLDGWYDGDDV